jgi:hypothetical protein
MLSSGDEAKGEESFMLLEFLDHRGQFDRIGTRAKDDRYFFRCDLHRLQR